MAKMSEAELDQIVADLNIEIELRPEKTRRRLTTFRDIEELFRTG
jgi:hypothetical protein